MHRTTIHAGDRSAPSGGIEDLLVNRDSKFGKEEKFDRDYLGRSGTQERVVDR